jgi:queuosine precursor transporter
MRLSTAICVVVYVAAIVTANLLVAEFGPAISVFNAFVLIGLDLSLRDYLHDVWASKRALKLGLLIGSAGVISFVLNPASGRIAVASTVAFVCAACVDWCAYHLMRRYGWSERANASNIAGAGVDSFLFPAIAFGMPILWPIVLGQFTAKVAGGAIWALVISFARRWRAAAHG